MFDQKQKFKPMPDPVDSWKKSRGDMLLVTPQQEIGKRGLFEAELGRSCLVHCAQVTRWLLGDTAEDLVVGDSGENHILDVVNRIDSVSGERESYQRGIGWSLIAIADDLRGINKSRGLCSVVVQNLSYDAGHTDIDQAERVGRASSDDEIRTLEELSFFGGTDRSKWIQAVGITIKSGGLPIVIVRIPSGDDNQEATGHSVVVLLTDDDNVTFFDPDEFAISRYTQRGLPNPGIRRISHQGLRREKRLLYTQPVNEFVARMSGEVIHVHPSPRTLGQRALRDE